MRRNIVADSFAALWLHCVRGRVPSRAFLRTIIRNKICDHYRSRRRKYEVATAVLPEECPDDTFATIDTGILVQRALHRLPRRHRAVLELVYQADLSIPVAAEALGISPGTLRTRLLRARRALATLCARTPARSTPTRP